MVSELLSGLITLMWFQSGIQEESIPIPTMTKPILIGSWNLFLGLANKKEDVIDAMML